MIFITEHYDLTKDKSKKSRLIELNIRGLNESLPFFCAGRQINLPYKKTYFWATNQNNCLGLS